MLGFFLKYFLKFSCANVHCQHQKEDIICGISQVYLAIKPENPASKSKHSCG